MMSRPRYRYSKMVLTTLMPLMLKDGSSRDWLRMVKEMKKLPCSRS